jgi:hypothetical protein
MLHSYSFKKYLENVERENLHPKHKDIFQKYYTKTNKNTLNHYIFYGVSGVGKYSQLLYFLSYFSESKLSYEKKISIQISRNHEYITKLSDIHYEIDISLLGCNSKSSFNIIYNHIIDILSVVQRCDYKFIVCKNFHKIHPELLEVFYSYMTNVSSHTPLQFILLTESISFIPTSILDLCEFITFKRPSASLYKKIANGSCIVPNNITNIRFLHEEETTPNHYILCNRIIQHIHNMENTDLFKFREVIYKLLIIQLDVETSIMYIIEHLFDDDILSEEKSENKDKDKDKDTKISPPNIHRKLSNICFDFYTYYQNNYRCIYHLEKLFLNISKAIADV